MGQAAVPDALAGFGDTSFAGRLHRLWHPAVLAAGAGAGKLGGRVHHRPGLYGAAAGGVAVCGRRGHDGARARIAGDGAGIQHGLSGFRSGGQGGGRTPRARCHGRAGIEVTALRAVPMPFNTLVWRVLAKTPDDHYYEAVSGWFDRTSPEWLRLPLNPDAGANLAGSALHDRLRWFTGDWLRHDVIGDALVVTDLRMGVAGHYTFRFKMAERAPGPAGSRSCPAAGPAPAGLAGAETGIGAHSGCAAAVAAASLVGPGLALGSCPCRPRTAARPSTASSSPGARPRHGASPCVAFLSSIVQGEGGTRILLARFRFRSRDPKCARWQSTRILDPGASNGLYPHQGTASGFRVSGTPPMARPGCVAAARRFHLSNQ